MNELTTTQEYKLLVDKIKTTITESVYNSRWALVEGYWTIGKLIRENFKNDVTAQLQRVGVDTGISKTTLWYAVQTYDKYPKIDTLPEGKNISWKKLITKYLPNGGEDKKKVQVQDKHVICPMCGYKFDITRSDLKAVARG